MKAHRGDFIDGERKTFVAPVYPAASIKYLGLTGSSHIIFTERTRIFPIANLLYFYTHVVYISIVLYSPFTMSF